MSGDHSFAATSCANTVGSGLMLGGIFKFHHSETFPVQPLSNMCASFWGGWSLLRRKVNNQGGPFEGFKYDPVPSASRSNADIRFCHVSLSIPVQDESIRNENTDHSKSAENRKLQMDF